MGSVDISVVIESRTRDRKVAGSNPRCTGAEFSSPGSIFCTGFCLIFCFYIYIYPLLQK